MFGRTQCRRLRGVPWKYRRNDSSLCPYGQRDDGRSEGHRVALLEQERRVFREIDLPVGPAMAAAGLVPDVLHVFLREQVVHTFDTVVAGVFGTAADPEDFELLIQHS